MPEAIFVIGAARSGTKFLRDVIGASPDVSVVPYDINYIWRSFQEDAVDDELSADNLSAKQREHICRSVMKQAKGSSNSRFVVEKTVSNSLRVPYVDSLFPDARFIHLVRDGRDVVESSYRQWLAPPEWKYLLKKARSFPWSNSRYAWWFLKNRLSFRSSGSVPVWGPRYRGIARDIEDESLIRVCARQWQRCVESASSALAEIEPSRVIELRYENLVADASVIEQICAFVGLEDSESVLAELNRTRKLGLMGRWKTDLKPEESRMMLNEIGSTLTQYGYG